MRQDEGAACCAMQVNASRRQAENGAGQILCQDGPRWSLRMHRPLPDHDQMVGAGCGPVQVMQYDRHATAPVRVPARQLQDKRLMGRVLGGNRFIKQEETGGGSARHGNLKLHQHTGKMGALAFTARQGHHLSPGKAFQPDLPHQRIGQGSLPGHIRTIGCHPCPHHDHLAHQKLSCPFAFLRQHGAVGGKIPG